MRISVYIPCYNAAEYLARCIEGVLTQTLAADEVLVVDDGSRDASLHIAARYPHVRILRHEMNKGLSAARNTAFQAARNEWVAALDADCVAQPQWLEALARRAEKGDVSGVCGRLVETVLDTVGDRWRQQHLRQDWGDLPSDLPAFLFGNNTLLRKSAVAAAGGYDERLRTNGEDVDLSGKLRRAGHCLSYQPDALVHHLRHDTGATALATYWRYRRNHVARTTWHDVWSNCRYQHFGSARRLLGEDLRTRRLEFLPLDLWMFVYFPWLDLREAMKAVPQAPVQKLSEA